MVAKTGLLIKTSLQKQNEFFKMRCRILPFLLNILGTFGKFMFTPYDEFTHYKVSFCAV